MIIIPYLNSVFTLFHRAHFGKRDMLHSNKKASGKVLNDVIFVSHNVHISDHLLG